MAHKKEKKKKLTKEERKRLKKEEQERLAQEAEQARIQAEEDERTRQEQERLAAEEQRLRDAEERVLRRKQLITTNETVQNMQRRLTEAQTVEHDQQRWERYMRCDGLPDPLTRQQVTAYLTTWRECLNQTETHPEVMRRTDEVLRIIADLQRHVHDAAYGDGELAQDMTAILQQYQDTQTAKLDIATYNVLTDMRPHVDLETNTVQFCSSSPYLCLALWSNCSKNLKNKGYFFKELGVRFELPKSLMDQDIAVRIMRTEYDHISKFCPSNKMLDLAEFKARETLSDVILEEDVGLEREQEEAHRVAVEKEEREAAEAEIEAAAALSAAKDKKRPGWMSAGSSRSASPDKSSGAGSPTKSKSPKAKKGGKKGKRGKKSKSRSPKRKTITPVPEPVPVPEVVKVPTLLVLTANDELNLRRYRVIGGLIQFDLLNIPPQPKVVGGWTLREICEPETVRPFPFSADYRAPAAADGQTSRRREPEEIEREIRQQEAEMQKLISVSVDEVSMQSSLTESGVDPDGSESHPSAMAETEPPAEVASTPSARSALASAGATSRQSRVRIASGDGDPSRTDSDAATAPQPEQEPQLPSPICYELEVADHPENFPLLETRLPDTTLWFEPPFFVRWDEKNAYWSTEGFYDTRYNEETYVLQARTLRLGLFGLAVNRFSNLPYQSWSFTPTGAASAELSITAAVAAIRLTIQDDLVTLCQATGGSSACLDSFYNHPMKPEKLIQVLQTHGLDLFPEEDSYLYIEGSSLKHQPCEKHLYWCMALVGNAYGFSSSRWNLLAGTDNLVLQFREMLSDQLQGNPALLLVRPRKTTIVECIETSQAWNDAEAPAMSYFADLYHLVQGLGSEEARARLQSAPSTFVDCLHDLFTACRLLSYS